MNYEEASSYLRGTINETASRRQPTRLERMRLLLRELGDPQNAYPTIHVGGTSGKGSTATMIAAAFTASGLRAGLHTKPHLSSMTERARIDGSAIGEDVFADLLSEMLPAIERTVRVEGRPSYYETLLALAFAHFAREAVDVGVIEVGIGGSLDGTNVLLPEVAVITNVGLDHTEILGETKEEIARDKAGIAKPGVPLVSDATRSSARRHCRGQPHSGRAVLRRPGPRKDRRPPERTLRTILRRDDRTGQLRSLAARSWADFSGATPRLRSPRSKSWPTTCVLRSKAWNAASRSS